MPTGYILWLLKDKGTVYRWVQKNIENISNYSFWKYQRNNKTYSFKNLALFGQNYNKTKNIWFIVFTESFWGYVWNTQTKHNLG